LISYTDAIAQAHFEGLEQNKKSYIIGLGVNYPNGADGTTKGLAASFPERVLDCPVSESAVTGFCVGMATMGFNTIVHHGRVEFALLAMDQILTQAAKWDYMFGGDYPCKFSARLNIGRQWGNGPQHTSSYNSLFANTPGLTVLWPSRPSEAYQFTKYMHKAKSPSIHMEHRWLFKTTDVLNESLDSGQIQTASIYGDCSDIVIITYGDSLVEALKVQEAVSDRNISVVCLTAFHDDRSLPDEVVEAVNSASELFVLDSSNYEYGLLQGVVGSLAIKRVLPEKVKVFAPEFIPVATAAKLVQEYYPVCPTIIDFMNSTGMTNVESVAYTFDEINLPPNFDFSQIKPSKIVMAKE